MSKNIKNITVILVTIFLAVSMTSGCLGDEKPAEANNSTVTYTTSNSPIASNFWMYMYMAHMFDSQRVVYVNQHHYYSTHPSSSTPTPKVTDVKPATKKESFFSKASNFVKSETKKAESSFKASKTGFKSSGSSYKSSPSFKSSGSGFSSSRSSFRSSRR
jgi:hypothetical protein